MISALFVSLYSNIVYIYSHPVYTNDTEKEHYGDSWDIDTDIADTEGET